MPIVKKKYDYHFEASIKDMLNRLEGTSGSDGHIEINWVTGGGDKPSCYESISTSELAEYLTQCITGVVKHDGEKQE